MRRGSFVENFPVTSVILLLCVALALIAGSETQRRSDGEKNLIQGFLDPSGMVLIDLGATGPLLLRQGEWWRLLSYAFLHGGPIHLLMNMASLWSLGIALEPLLGKYRFTIVYLGTAAVAALASLLYNQTLGSQFATAVGASGAICGLLGHAFGFSIRHKDRELRMQVLNSIVFLIAMVFLTDRIDHAAHAGGLLAGAVFGYFTPRYVTSRAHARWKIPFWVAVALAAAALGVPITKLFLARFG